MTTPEELLRRYHSNRCSEAEKALVEQWYLQYNDYPIDISDDKIAQIGEEIWQRLPVHRKIFPWKRLAVAATFLFALSASIYLYLHNSEEPTPSNGYAYDIEPGGNKAILTLSTGEKISLTDANTGQILTQKNTVISKTTEGSVIYKEKHDDEKQAVEQMSYNTIATPRGGQYQVVLPDGTKVWLNAISSLKFPVSFSPFQPRKVELIGEAYFEVAHNAAQPFIVKTETQEVEVLGTHFNINSYADEPYTRTTLLSGSVRIVQPNGESAMLKPGEQSVVSGKADDGIQLAAVEVESAVDWKNDEFIFAGDKLAIIMREIARWYEVEVSYENESLKDEVFVGSISRLMNVSQVLDMLALTGTVHFKIEVSNNSKERRIMVMN